MYYTIYKIINKINNKYYIGMHKTKNLDDGYMGSGKNILASIKKYGNDNFIKEILFIFDNENEMINKEKELVTEELLNDNLCYNLKLGGSSNFYYVNKYGKNIEKGQHLIHSNRCKNDLEYRKQFSEKMKIVNKEKSHKQKGIPAKNKGFIWIHKNNELKMIQPHELNSYIMNGWIKGFVSKRTKNKIINKNNSQYGTMWITNGIDNKKIKKDLDAIPDGWYKGRSKW